MVMMCESSPGEDRYQWLCYGKRRSSKGTKSCFLKYYKCKEFKHGCQAKKYIYSDSSPVVYKQAHNHDPPQDSSRHKPGYSKDPPTKAAIEYNFYIYGSKRLKSGTITRKYQRCKCPGCPVTRYRDMELVDGSWVFKCYIYNDQEHNHSASPLRYRQHVQTVESTQIKNDFFTLKERRV